MEKLYTVKETAEIFRVNPETVKRMIYRNQLFAAKVGRNWRISENEIKKYLERK